MELTERQRKLLKEASIADLKAMQQWANTVIDSWNDVEVIANGDLLSSIIKEMDSYQNLTKQIKHYREVRDDVEFILQIKTENLVNIQSLIPKDMSSLIENPVCLMQAKPGYTTIIDNEGNIFQTTEEAKNEFM